MRPIAAWLILVQLLSGFAIPAAHGAQPDGSSSPSPAATSRDAGRAGPADVLRGWLSTIATLVDAVPVGLSVPHPREALACEARRSNVGDGEPIDPTSAFERPRGALRDAVSGWTLPQRGYEGLAGDEDAMLFGFEARGRTKVAVRVVRGRHGWFPAGLAACRLAEFGADARMGPGVWLWADRRGRTLEQRRLSVDCGSPFAHVILWRPADRPDRRAGIRWYVRDPEGTFRDLWRAPYLRRTRLPRDARDTGYRRGRDRIWMAPDGRSIYVGRGRSVERWPRIRAVGCL